MLAAVCSLTLCRARNFVGIGNYIKLDQASRGALDHLSLAIRQTAGLKSDSPRSLTFTNRDNSEREVTWNPETRKMTQTQNGTTKTLLTECGVLEQLRCQPSETAKWYCYQRILNA